MDYPNLESEQLAPEVAHPPVADHVHEDTDVSIRGLGIFLGSLAITLVIVGFIVAWLFNIFLAEAQRADLSPSPLAGPDSPTPAPVLQIAERRDMQLFREREARILHETVWIDREQGIVRIPIDRAIELTAERGLPDWPPAAAEEEIQP